MREIRLFGSEGGVALTLPSLPLSKCSAFGVRWSSTAFWGSWVKQEAGENLAELSRRPKDCGGLVSPNIRQIVDESDGLHPPLSP